MSLIVELMVFEEAIAATETTTWKLAHRILSEWVDFESMQEPQTAQRTRIQAHLYKLVMDSSAVL